MAWEIEVSDEFKEWYESLTDEECSSVHNVIDALVQLGPALGRPQVDTLNGSRYSNMKELRIQHQGKPYIDAIRRADLIYAEHLEEIGG